MTANKKIEMLNKLIMQEARGIEDTYNIKDNTDLVDDLGYDSVAIIKLIVNIEDGFGFEFGDADMVANSLMKYTNLKEYVLKNAK